jgi:DNA-damage-inducible protein J
MTKKNIHIRIDEETKSKAEEILYSLDLTPSQAIRMFYKQIIKYENLPFDINHRPLNV